ncbi:MAG: hypothetical protein ACI9U2_002782 [Bradymonadia bacterium]|jgi:hypothetical protein
MSRQTPANVSHARPGPQTGTQPVGRPAGSGATPISVKSRGGWEHAVISAAQDKKNKFVKRVFAAEFGVYGWSGNGGDMMDGGNMPSKATAIRDGSAKARKPVAGDAVIYKGSQWGHVALTSRIDGDDVFIIGQNEATRERRAQWRNNTLTDPSFPTMPLIGWVHVDANTSVFAPLRDRR